MAGKLCLAILAILLVPAFLLAFSSTHPAEALKWKPSVSFGASCGGRDLNEATGADNSCAAGTARSALSTADMSMKFDQPAAGQYNPPGLPAPVLGWSNFSKVLNFSSPPEAYISPDASLPNGALAGKLTAIATLSVLNGPCQQTIPVLVDLYDSSTNTADVVRWDNLSAGANMVADPDLNGLPEYVDHYPDFLNTYFNNVRPYARYSGHTVVQAGAPPTTIMFVVFAPGQMSQFPANPEKQINASLGYTNFVIQDNPLAAQGPTTITEFCTPLGTDTTLYGRSQGKGKLGLVGGNLEMTNPDLCDGLDNDANTWPDEFCGIVRFKSPAAATGIYGSNTHLSGIFATSLRDIDGDGLSDAEDTCPLKVNTGVDADNDALDSACDPNDAVASAGAPAVCLASVVGLPDFDQDCYPDRGDNCPLRANGVDKNGNLIGPNNQDDQDEPLNVTTHDGGPTDDGIGDACEPDWDGGGLGAGDLIRPDLAPAEAGVQCTALGYPANGRGVDDDADTVADDGCNLSATFADGPYSKDLVRGATCSAVPATTTKTGAFVDRGSNTISVQSAAGFAVNDNIIIGIGSNTENRTVAAINGTTFTLGDVPATATTLSALAPAGQTFVTVVSATGLKVSDRIVIGAGATAEVKRITSISGTTLNLVNALTNAQAAGLSVRKVLPTVYPHGGGEPAVEPGTAPADADGDGWCDPTESALGSQSAAVSTTVSLIAPIGSASITVVNATNFGVGMPLTIDTGGNAEVEVAVAIAGNVITLATTTQIAHAVGAAVVGQNTPEYYGIDYTLIDPPPVSCTDRAWYDTVPWTSSLAAQPGGVGADNDGDTLVNALDLVGCTCNVANDTDCDGVLNVGPPADNCAAVYNPDQSNKDGDAIGDACDTDADGDKVLDTAEWNAGNDTSTICSPRNYDVNGDTVVAVNDVTAITGMTGKQCPFNAIYSVR